MALGCLLADAGHSVTVFEKKNVVGGSWKSVSQDGYFTENSPRILAGSAGGFFKYLGLADSDFYGVYGNAFQSNLHIMRHVFRFLSFSDVMSMLGSMLFGVSPKISLGEWMESRNISERGARGLEILSIAINDVPAKTNAREFFNIITAPQFKGVRQFRDPNKWWTLAVQRISSKPGCSVVVNAGVSSVTGPSAAEATGVMVNGEYHPADRVVLCTQSTGLLPVLRGTPFEKNWSMVTPEWVEDTAYHAFSFQLHFDKPVEAPGHWCWSCAGPWTVIILPVGDWLDKKSDDPEIVDVWSCCVVDTGAPSPFLGGKSANDTQDPYEVLGECLRQIRAASGGPVEPKRVTLSPGLYHNGTRWVSAETGFTSGVRGRVPVKGKAENLFAVGCFSESYRPTTAHFGTAVDAVISFVDTHEPGVRYFGETPVILLALLVITLLITLFV